MGSQGILRVKKVWRDVTETSKLWLHVGEGIMEEMIGHLAYQRFSMPKMLASTLTLEAMFGADPVMGIEGLEIENKLFDDISKCFQMNMMKKGAYF